MPISENPDDKPVPPAAASKPRPANETPTPDPDEQNQATVEELGREGLGVAAKE